MAKNEQVRVDLVAEDNASKTIDAVAKKVDKLEGAGATIEVDADTKGVERDMSALLSKVDKLTAEPAMLLLATNAADITKQIGGLLVDIDRLDASDPTVDVKAEQVNALTADLETLQAKARELDAQQVDIKVDTSGAVGGIDRLRDSSDQTRSVMANMAGNAAQDLGEVGGVAGTAGVAIGQLAEYATEGNIGLKNLVGLAGPMVALGVATKAVSTYMEGINAERAFRAELVKEFTSAMRDASTVAEDMLDTLRETGDLEFSAGGAGFLGFGRQAESILPIIDRLKLEWGVFQGDLADPAAVSNLEYLITQLELSGDVTSQQLGDWNAYKDIIEQYGGAAREAAAIDEIRARVLDEAGGSATDAALATAQHKQHLDEASEASLAYEATTVDASAATDDLAESAREALDVEQLRVDALNAIVDALLAQVGGAADLAGANRDYAESEREAADARQATIDAVNEHGAASREAADAATAEADAIIASADAALGQYEAMTMAAGATATATGKLDQQNRTLIDQATKATPQARRQIVDYIGDLNGIPEEERTDILTLLDQGKVAEAEARINQTSRTRKTTINADANTSQAESDLNHAARDRTARVSLLVANRNIMAQLGNNAPILNMLPPGGETPAPPVATPVINVTQYVPRGWRGDALAQATSAARRSGGLYRHVRR
jgi:hypothetical protein